MRAIYFPILFILLTLSACTDNVREKVLNSKNVEDAIQTAAVRDSVISMLTQLSSSYESAANECDCEIEQLGREKRDLQRKLSESKSAGHLLGYGLLGDLARLGSLSLQHKINEIEGQIEILQENAESDRGIVREYDAAITAVSTMVSRNDLSAYLNKGGFNEVINLDYLYENLPDLTIKQVKVIDDSFWSSEYMLEIITENSALTIKYDKKHDRVLEVISGQPIVAPGTNVGGEDYSDGYEEGYKEDESPQETTSSNRDDEQTEENGTRSSTESRKQKDSNAPTDEVSQSSNSSSTEEPHAAQPQATGYVFTGTITNDGGKSSDLVIESNIFSNGSVNGLSEHVGRNYSISGQYVKESGRLSINEQGGGRFDGQLSGNQYTGTYRDAEGNSHNFSFRVRVHKSWGENVETAANF